jgi:threonine 3-dehydrogenase
VVVEKTMQAVVKSKAEPGLWLEEVPVPEVGSDDVLIRVLKTSICGTDVHIYNWDPWAQKTIPVPMTIGHEFVGVVDLVGDHVKGFARGDLVVGEGHITCGHWNCRWASSSLPEHARCRRESPRRVGRVRGHSAIKLLAC